MKAEILVDYLTFTVKGGVTPEYVITDILEMDLSLFDDIGKGQNLYASSKVYGNIRVNYNGYHKEDMGISVNMSGQGCRAYEEYHGCDILRLLKTIHHSNNMHGSRIDIACDDKIGMLNMDDMWEHAHNSGFRTKIKTKNFHESHKGKYVGARSIYFGSKSSLFLVRIYDKAKQMYHPEHDAEQYYSHWLRFECVFKDIYADQVIKALVESDDVGGTVAGLINDRFAFINNDDSNISRCTMCDWWSNFLDNMKNISLTTKAKIEHAIDEQWEYLKYSYGRFLERVISAKGEDKFIEDILQYGKSKLTKADKAQVKDYKEKREIDFWEPIFGRVSRKPKKLGDKYKAATYNGDLWAKEPVEDLEPSIFVQVGIDDDLLFGMS